MTTDAELIHRFVEDRSETAFTELVQRHVNLVRATALRRMGGDAHAADDVTQQVFVSLARKAGSLRGHATIAGWLYVGTHHATAALVRGEQRRRHREATAHSMHLADSSDPSPAEAARIRPLLDDALITLPPAEREAVVLRFFGGHTFAEVGDALKLSEEAARKRVSRALDKLQAVLVRRGITSSVAVLSSTLTAAGACSAIPAGFAAQVAGAALAKAAVPVAASSLAHLLWPAASAAALVGGILAIVPLHQANVGAAEALALREADTSAVIRGLETEIQQLNRDLETVQRPGTVAEPETSVQSPGPSLVAAAPTRLPIRTGKTVVVSPEGRLTWDGQPVDLETFLRELARFQVETATTEAAFVVQAHGARFSQLNWVIDEAHRAGVQHLVIESDAAPAPTDNTWF